MLISLDMLEWCDRHGLMVKLCLDDFTVKLIDAESDRRISESSIANAILIHDFALDKYVATAIKDAAKILRIEDYPVMATVH